MRPEGQRPCGTAQLQQVPLDLMNLSDGLVIGLFDHPVFQFLEPISVMLQNGKDVIDQRVQQ